MTNTVIVFIFSLAFSFCNRHIKKDLQNVSAEIVLAGLKNYKNKTFQNQPPWLEYFIVFKNKGKSSILILGNEGNLLINSANGELVDSFQLSSHPIFIKPNESDTIRTIELFLEKDPELDLSTWLEPNLEYALCRTYCLAGIEKKYMSDFGTTELIKNLKIPLSKSFSFNIE